MTKTRLKFVVLVASGLLFLIAFFWILISHGPLAAVSIEQGIASRMDLSPTVFGVGTVEGRLTYAIGPLAPGRVQKVLVDQGDEVKADQVLAEMDPIDLEQRIEANRSNVARFRSVLQAAQAQVAEALSRAKLAKINQERDQELFQKQVINNQVLDISNSEVERGDAALSAARANLEAVKQDIKRVEADLSGLEQFRESLRLRSPTDGVIISREVEPGTTVLAGQAILRMVVPSSLWVRARIDQSRANHIRSGLTAEIVLRSAAQEKRPGHVSRVELQSDPVTEERIVNISFDAPPKDIYLGDLAEVIIHLPKVNKVLTVPSAAISRVSGQVGVWQEVKGRAQFKSVVIGNQGQGGATEVLSGLNEGESVIVYSSALLNKDTRVREKKVGSQ